MSNPTSQPQFAIGAMLGQAWNMFTKNVGVLLGAYVLVAVILVVGNLITFYLASIVLTGPFMLGLTSLGLKIVRGQPGDFNEVFSGFKRFLPAFMANLLIAIFSAIGGILCVIPGLFVVMVYTLTYYFMADKNLDFWPAMEASRKVVMAALGPWILLFLTLLGINFLGAILCGLGTLVTVPLSILVLAQAYEQVKDSPAVTAS